MFACSHLWCAHVLTSLRCSSFWQVQAHARLSRDVRAATKGDIRLALGRGGRRARRCQRGGGDRSGRGCFGTGRFAVRGSHARLLAPCVRRRDCGGDHLRPWGGGRADGRRAGACRALWAVLAAPPASPAPPAPPCGLAICFLSARALSHSPSSSPALTHPPLAGLVPAHSTRFVAPAAPQPMRRVSTPQAWVTELNALLQRGLADHAAQPEWDASRTSRGGEVLLALQVQLRWGEGGQLRGSAGSVTDEGRRGQAGQGHSLPCARHARKLGARRGTEWAWMWGPKEWSAAHTL